MNPRSPESNAFPEVERFIESLRLRGCPEGTLVTYRYHLVSFLRFLREHGVGALRELRRDTVRAFPGYLANQAARGGRLLSPGTQARRIATVRSFFRFLLEQRLVLVDPTAGLRGPRDVRRLPTVLTAEDRERLFGACDLRTVLGYRDRAMFEVLYATGLRVTELVRLRVEHLRLAEGLLVVREGKGAKDRVVPLGKRAADLLAEYVERVRPRIDRGRDPETHVFVTRRGVAFTRADVDELFRRYARRAGLGAHVTPHSLRHTCATDLLRRGADLRHIQEMLGHARLATTQQYLHVVRKELKRVHERAHPRERAPFDAVPFVPEGGSW